MPLPPVVWEGDCRGSDAYGLHAPDTSTRIAELERDLAVAREVHAQQTQEIANLAAKVSAWESVGARLRELIADLP